MRIVGVSFENLNSLAGSWKIDFEHDEFVGNGIFAITGPTGAGKTTILDAICLALYGATPRLGKLSKGSNELMSRHTGHCRAEVVFETERGRYISFWAQHRARRKADGELQQPMHEVADASTGMILAKSIKESSALIVELTGMGFEQFTRSMLLAQGAFAAFLQAKPEDRAPVLEQITGTGIYSEISMLVHQCRNEQQDLLRQLMQELDAGQVLNDEDRQALINLSNQLQQQVTAMQQRQHELKSMMSLMERRQELELRCKDLADAYQTIQQQFAAFAPERECLEKARRAAGLKSEFRIVEALRQELVDSDLQLTKVREDIQNYSNQLQIVRNAVQQTAGVLQTRRQTAQQMQPILEKTRHLDRLIGQRRGELEIYQQQCAELERSIAVLVNDEQKVWQKLQALNLEKEEVAVQMATAASDEFLVSGFSGIQLKLEQLIQLRQEIADQESLVTKLYAGLDAAIKQVNERRHLHERMIVDLEASKLGLRQAQLELDNCLRQKTMQQWQAEQANLMALENQCMQAIDLVGKIGRLGDGLERQREGLSGLQHQHEVVSADLGATQREADLQRERLKSLLQIQLLQQQIENYEAARTHLIEGEPCPLCGSTDHPYVQGLQLDHDLHKKIAECRQEVERLDGRLRYLQQQLAAVEFKKHEYERKIGEDVEQLQLLQARLPILLEQLGVADISGSESAGMVLNQVLDAIRKQGKDVADVMDQASRLMDFVNQVQRKVAIADTEARTLGEWVAEATKNQEQIRFRIDETVKNREQLLIKRDGLAENLAETLVLVGETDVDLTDMTQIVALQERLVLRRDQWLELQSRKSRNEREISDYSQKTQYIRQHLQELGGQKQKLLDTIQAIGTKLEPLVAERKALLQSDDPDLVARHISDELDAAAKAFEQARQNEQEIQVSYHRLQQNETNLRSSIDMKLRRLQEIEPKFFADLRQNGFADEGAFLAATLSESEFGRLEKQERELNERRTSLQAEMQSVQGQLVSLNQKLPEDVSVDSVHQEHEVVTSQIRISLEELGAVKQRLEDDALSRQRQAEVLTKVRKQEAEVQRWDLLHSLIGSADGKKFRTFAQGLTFDWVIHHANQQLLRMTDRYLLVRGEQEPLELNVIDQYQAGETRSTKNLSGGESFLVSLALALGLSTMASRNVRVDSLFLDEGFGTLDEDALEMALQTLATLPQEGKLIGVISHVQALKDRISTQIQVMPMRGGRSILVGPGCCQG